MKTMLGYRYVLSNLLLILDLIVQEGKGQDTKKAYKPGYICNYEKEQGPNSKYVFYTCVHESKCNSKAGRHRAVQVDNCPLTFLPPPEGKYVCCHPSDNKEASQIPQIKDPYELPFMPGYRSEVKCNDFKTLGSLLAKPPCSATSKKENIENTVTELGKPYLALLGYYRKDKQRWYCLGSIVSKYFILSSAACHHEKDSGIFTDKARVGETEFCQVGKCKDSSFSQMLPVEDRVLYPKKKDELFCNNIMLLLLAEPIKWNQQVRPACLPNRLTAQQHSNETAKNEERPKDKLNGVMRVRTQVHNCEWQIIGVFAYSPECKYSTSNPASLIQVTDYLDWIESEVWAGFDTEKEWQVSALENGAKVVAPRPQEYVLYILLKAVMDVFHLMGS